MPLRHIWKECGNLLELYIPNVEDMWFVRQMQEDPETMAYNAGWDVSFEGYHPHTGCIDLPESKWAEKHRWLVGHEPERFYAFVRRKTDGAFVGEVNFHYDPDEKWWDMGILLYAPFRGMGYGRPAMEFLLERAFLNCGVTRLHNNFEKSRGAATALHLAAGFELVGTGNANRFGKPIELQELLLTRERYLEMRTEILQIEEPDEKANLSTLILGELPDWFGLPECTAEYIAQSARMPFWSAVCCGEVLGFAAMKETGPQTAEIYVIGVRSQYHRSGVGKRLFSALAEYARANGYRFLQVKTVQTGRYEKYDRTNAFYQSLGFVEFECFPEFWDSWNPCQVYVMSLDSVRDKC